jgi:hypothetical protein
MFGFSPLCATAICATWQVGTLPVPTLPAEALAQLYGGSAMQRGKKKKREEEDVPLAEMVRTIAVDYDHGPRAIVKVFPKFVQKEIPAPDLLPLYELIKKVEASSAAVRSRIVALYQEIEDDEDMELFSLVMRYERE